MPGVTILFTALLLPRVDMLLERLGHDTAVGSRLDTGDPSAAEHALLLLDDEGAKAGSMQRCSKRAGGAARRGFRSLEHRHSGLLM